MDFTLTKELVLPNPVSAPLIPRLAYITLPVRFGSRSQGTYFANPITYQIYYVAPSYTLAKILVTYGTCFVLPTPGLRDTFNAPGFDTFKTGFGFAYTSSSLTSLVRFVSRLRRTHFAPEIAYEIFKAALCYTLAIILRSHKELVQLPKPVLTPQKHRRVSASLVPLLT